MRWPRWTQEHMDTSDDFVSCFACQWDSSNTVQFIQAFCYSSHPALCEAESP